MKKITDVSKVAIALDGLVPDAKGTIVYDWDTGELVEGWTSVSLHINVNGLDWGIIVKDEDDHKILFDGDNAFVFVTTPDFTLRAAKNHVKKMSKGMVDE